MVAGELFGLMDVIERGAQPLGKRHAAASSAKKAPLLHTPGGSSSPTSARSAIS
jgi:hypothetical protein